MAINWKHDYLELADTIDRFLNRYPAQGRVTELMQGYGEVFRCLLGCEVNGGLDECFTEFPDAPLIENCSEGCYCDRKNGEIKTEPDGDPEAHGPS